MIPISRLSGILSQTSGVAIATGTMPTPPSSGFTTIQLTPIVTGVLPFSFGQAFRQGDIPAGQTLAGVQLSPSTYYPDGSVRFGVIAGGASMTSGTTKTIGLQLGAGPIGSSLTIGDLKATNITAGIDCGIFGSVAWSGADWDTAFKNHISGPLMSSWVYMKSVGADAHLTAWVEVRLFLSGEVEVLPWIENGYLQVAGPTNKNTTYIFTLNGAQKFNQIIDIKHHQRTPLIAGTIVSYWTSADPDFSVRHDVAYLQQTEMVPSYRATLSAGAARVTAQPSSFTPLQQGSFTYDSDSMPSSGYQSPIGLLPEHDVLYLVANTADAKKVYKSVIWNGYSAGRYGIHWRDESTGRPLRFSSYSTLNIGNGQGFKDNLGYGNVTPAVTGGNPPTWDVAHSPSVGYMAYLITGRWYFLEEVQFAATTNFLGKSYAPEMRNGNVGLVKTAIGAWQTRSAAWQFRTLFEAHVVTPDSDSVLKTEFKNCIQANIDHYYTRYVGQSANIFGLIEPGEEYSGSLGQVAIWQQDFFTAVIGFGLALNSSLDGGYQSKLSSFFSWKAQGVVRRLGLQTDWWYVNPAPYTLMASSSISPDYSVGTGPFNTVSQAYTATYTPTPSWLSNTEGVLSSEFWPETSTPSMFSNLQPAIAYAVRHNVPEATVAYNRMINASNWSQYLTAVNTKPVWSVKPAFIAATTIALSGPSSGTVSASSANFTVTLDGSVASSVLVTPNDGGKGGVFTPSSVSLSTLTPSTTFTYTPATTGSITISISNNGGLGSSPVSLPYMSNALSSGGPAWLNGKAVNEWFQISGTTGAGGAAINAWGGFAVKDNTSEVFFAASGGHNDSYDNRVVSIDLRQDAPTWQLRCAPTPFAQVVANSSYYLDGKPVSRHNYNHNHWVPQINRIMLFCTHGWYSSGGGTKVVNGFNPDTNTWDPAGTYPDQPAYGSVLKIGSTGEAFSSTGDRWNPSTNVWTKITTFTKTFRFPSAFDSSRNQIFCLQFGDGQGYDEIFGVVASKIDAVTGTQVSITFNSSSALTQFIADKPAYAGMDYDSDLDVFYFYAGHSDRYRIYVITPNVTSVWDMSFLTLGAGSASLPAMIPAGINGRFKYIPAYKGILMLVDQVTNLYFIRTS